MAPVVVPLLKLYPVDLDEVVHVPVVEEHSFQSNPAEAGAGLEVQEVVSSEVEEHGRRGQLALVVAATSLPPLRP